jgi:hypothetical protein
MLKILHECLLVSSPDITITRVRLVNTLLFVGSNKVQRWVAPVTNTNTKFSEKSINWWQKQFKVAHRWRVDRIGLYFFIMKESQTITQLYCYWYLKPLQKPALFLLLPTVLRIICKARLSRKAA